MKAHAITLSTPASTVSGAASVDAAASKLLAAAYPFIKDVDWTSNLFSKPIPGESPQAVLKAVDKMIVMGAAMDGAALQEAAKAHVKAIDGIDAKGVLSQADFEAINAGLGKAVATARDCCSLEKCGDSNNAILHAGADVSMDRPWRRRYAV